VKQKKAEREAKRKEDDRIAVSNFNTMQLKMNYFNSPSTRDQLESQKKGQLRKSSSMASTTVP